MDSFTFFTDLFAEHDVAVHSSSTSQWQEDPEGSSEVPDFADSERYGSGTLTAFCVIA